MQKRIMTLSLHPNGMQRRYMIQQWIATLRLYQEECRNIKNQGYFQEQFLMEKTFLRRLNYAQRHYLPTLHDIERYAMCRQLCRYQRQFQCNIHIDIPQTYQAHDVLQAYCWRNIDLFRLMHLHHYWQKEVFTKPWQLQHSVLYYQRGIFYVTLTFIKKKR